MTDGVSPLRLGQIVTTCRHEDVPREWWWPETDPPVVLCFACMMRARNGLVKDLDLVAAPVIEVGRIEWKTKTIEGLTPLNSAPK